MAKEAPKKPIPKAEDVPSVAPLVDAVGRAKTRLQSAAASATTDGSLNPAAPTYRAARKRVKRAQRRLRRELRRVPPEKVVAESPAGTDAAPAAPADSPAEAPADTAAPAEGDAG